VGHTPETHGFKHLCGHETPLPALTAILPFRSLWTTPNAVEPRRSQERKGERLSLDARRKTIYKKRRHTEKTDEALGSLQEGEGVDTLISDGNLCEGLKKARGRSE
jgi:hypothetical protein